ncbi:SRPBCC family protein [Nitrosovibrio tenuis]|uniref:Polyketide cyclase / dehydrase and lipid transport n=1 Tax=Nitrosovibrio tenuis TaxID=1233 RepID=A0A1H7LZG0_9PROT|nr:SRPBCC family protein [Nitrosovibrio tenuis]SEL04262.1 Polyketide cyclase / dehydrase and lipid transport [Nitrosovibrio tenuis]
MRGLIIFAVAAVFAASSAQALDVKSPGVDWTEAYRTDELVIFTKDVGKDRKIIATAEVEASPNVVFKVVSDFEHYRDFMPYVEESRVLTRKGDNEAVTYARIAPPFVSKRDYPLKVRMTRGSPSNGGVFKVEWTAHPEAEPEVEGVVRVKLNEGSWLAAPLNGGKRTRLTYTLLTNPGGLIPDFVVNLSNTVAIPELFDAVKKRSVEKSSVQK